jgi:hypothetical protein
MKVEHDGRSPNADMAKHWPHGETWQRAKRTPGVAAHARTVAVLQTTGAPKGISAHSRTMPMSKAYATSTGDPSRDWVRVQSCGCCPYNADCACATPLANHRTPLPLAARTLIWDFGSLWRHWGQLLLVDFVILIREGGQGLEHHTHRLERSADICKNCTTSGLGAGECRTPPTTNGRVGPPEVGEQHISSERVGRSATSGRLTHISGRMVCDVADSRRSSRGSHG